METKIDILAIDDDKFVQKMIVKALQSGEMSIRVANDGESGIAEATQQVPDIILLDVEMPGINGYETCDRLRNLEATKDVPIVFLSSHSSLRERLQGYEVGADDYVIKPFEAEDLLARINVLIKYQEDRKELLVQYEVAHKNAILAMTSSSELALAMRFLEKSLSYHDIDNLVQGLFESMDQLSLNCCAMISANQQHYWYSSEGSGSISPLEKELIEMCDKGARFLDFGERTIINYPKISLLVKNMPLDEMERYGRIKDLIPMFLSAVNTKISTLNTQEALMQQSTNLIDSFSLIRKSLYHLGVTIVDNRRDSTKIMNALVQELNVDFLRMGLEEDQEEYLLTRVDTALEQAMIEMDAGKEIRASLTFILSSLKSVMKKQDELLNAYIDSLASESTDHNADMDDNVELF